MARTFDMMADPVEIDRAGKQTSKDAESYIDSVRKIYAAIETMKNSWKGIDTESFIEKMAEYEENIKALGEVLNNYGTFMSETAKSLQDLQADIASGASNL